MIQASAPFGHKAIFLRIPNREYSTFVLDCLAREDSIWRAKNVEHFIMDQFPEIKDVSSSKVKKRIKKLFKLHLIPPQTVIAKEGDVSDHIKLLVGGKVECFRMIKESKDRGPESLIKLSLDPR